MLVLGAASDRVVFFARSYFYRSQHLHQRWVGDLCVRDVEYTSLEDDVCASLVASMWVQDVTPKNAGLRSPALVEHA